MPQYSFEGQTYNFPDDVQEQEVLNFLDPTAVSDAGIDTSGSLLEEAANPDNLSADFLPVIGEMRAVRDARKAFAEGNNLEGSIAALGAIPILGATMRFGKAAAKTAEALYKSGNVRESIDKVDAVHFGDLGTAVDTLDRSMSAGRGTGHFGTGTYLLSKEAAEKGIKEGRGGKFAREPRTVDMSGLNMFKPPNTSEALRLHDGMREILYLSGADSVTPELATKIINSTSDVTPGGDSIKEVAREIAEKRVREGLDPEDLAALNDPDDFMFEEIDLQRMINKETDTILYGTFSSPGLANTQRKLMDFLDVTGKARGLELIEAKSILNKRVKEAKLGKVKKEDVRTPATRVMQDFGYDGVDVRGTDADTMTHGSVIYVTPEELGL